MGQGWENYRGRRWTERARLVATREKGYAVSLKKENTNTGFYDKELLVIKIWGNNCNFLLHQCRVNVLQTITSDWEYVYTKTRRAHLGPHLNLSSRLSLANLNFIS